MKILHIAPLIERLGSSAPGGSEQIAISLAAAQARAGHDVSMVVCDDSRIPNGVTPVYAGIRPGMLIPIDTSRVTAAEAVQLHDARKLREERVYSALVATVANEQFDVIHNHAFDEALLFPDERLRAPVLHTLHCPPLVPWIVDRLRSFERSPRTTYVTVSRACANEWEQATGARIEVVYNGLELLDIPFGATPDHYFAWVGRISPEKGLHTALRLAAELRLAELKVFGRVYDDSYFERDIRAQLTAPNIEYYGFQPRDRIFPLLSRARALLAPIEWEEPFGLVFIESLAAGTPVIAYRRGAAAEIIEDGKTGFLVGTFEELCEAVGRLDSISRHACRHSVVERFDVDRMAANYLGLYAHLT